MWSLQDNDALSATLFIKLLKCLQNCCLHKIMKVYKRTFTAALKWELNVLLVNLHIKHKIIQRSFKTASY